MPFPNISIRDGALHISPKRKTLDINRDLEILEKGTPEYQQDLQRRRGGLVIDRKADQGKITNLLSAIQSGTIDLDQAQKYAHRNPGIEPAIQSAIQQKNILQQRFQPALPAREAVGITAPGEEPIMFPEKPAVSDPQGAIADLVRTGQLGKAQKIASLYGLGRQGSRAKIKTRKFFDERTGQQFEQDRDPITGQPMAAPMPTGLNVYDEAARKLSNTLSSHKIPLAIAPLLKVDQFMDKYAETGKLPGVGLLKNMQTAEFFRSPAGKVMANAARRLSELELRILTGAAAPDLEKRRVDVMNALSKANTADDYVRIYGQMVRPLWKDIMQNALGGVNPGVRNRWSENNPFARRINKFLSNPATPPFVPTGKPAAPKKSITEMSNEDLLSGF